MVEPWSRKRPVGSGTKNKTGSISSLKKYYELLKDKYTDLEKEHNRFEVKKEGMIDTLK